ncbi:MAG TPA: hypothetical protein VFR80_08110, partial [Pyrinomonadaceae bacterium]|nr:hypothetical protein [Pyrinomonadaceae bacterium]
MRLLTEPIGFITFVGYKHLAPTERNLGRTLGGKVKTLVVLALCALVVGNCGRGYHKKNQEQPLVSPSGKYILTVPI